MAEIKLLNDPNGRPAICDDEDHEFLSKFEWRLSPDGYAVTFIGRCELLMSNLVLFINDDVDCLALVQGDRSKILNLPDESQPRKSVTIC